MSGVVAINLSNPKSSQAKTYFFTYRFFLNCISICHPYKQTPICCFYCWNSHETKCIYFQITSTHLTWTFVRHKGRTGPCDGAVLSTNLVHVQWHGLFIIKVIISYFMVTRRFQPGKCLEHEKQPDLVVVFYHFSDFLSKSKKKVPQVDMRFWISTSWNNVCPVKDQWPVHGCMWRTTSNCVGWIFTSWVLHLLSALW